MMSPHPRRHRPDVAARRPARRLDRPFKSGAPGTAGYTLMEVLIAITILAMALTILIGTQANSAHMTERANRMAMAALLARGKMLDVENELLADGFSDMQETMNGDFHDEGFDEIEWEAVIDVVEIPPEVAPEFAAEVNAQLFGDGGEGGALSGSTAVSQWLPMMMAEVPNFVNDMAQRARRVTLTVSWEEGDYEQTLTVQQFVVNLNPGGAEGIQPTPGGPNVGNAADIAGQLGAGAPTIGGGP